MWNYILYNVSNNNTFQKLENPTQGQMTIVETKSELICQHKARTHRQHKARTHRQHKAGTNNHHKDGC